MIVQPHHSKLKAHYLKDGIQSFSFLMLLGALLCLVYSSCVYYKERSLQTGSKFYSIIRDDGIVRTVTLFLVALMCVTNGLLGFFGAAMRNMCLLGFFTLFMCLAITVNLTLIILATQLGYGTNPEKLPSKMRQSIEMYYGANVSDAAVQFTSELDNYQTENSCCGWTGNHDNKNSFVGSPWETASLAMQQTDSDQKMLFPNSCCTKRISESDVPTANQSSNTDAVGCSSAKGHSAVRHAGIIHPVDCLEQKMQVYQSRLHWAIWILASASMGQALLIAATITLLIEMSQGDQQSLESSPPTTHSTADSKRSTLKLSRSLHQ